MLKTCDIPTAARYIQEGKLVAFPTETVYGLGADALKPLAVAKIFEMKQRPSFDPLIVHIAEINDIGKLTHPPDNRIFQLAERFWPGPLTLVVPKSSLVPDIVTSGLPTVGIRIPDHPIALSLIKASRCPIAAPSANKFGRISPTSARHVFKQLPEVDCVLDGGKTRVGIESTIIRLTEKGFVILRNGIITREEIESPLPYDPDETQFALSAPGMMNSHYSPGKRMRITTPDLLSIADKNKTGLISFTGNMETGFQKVIRVSWTGDIREYAVHLFGALHTFEEDPEIDLILAEPVPDAGIGIAIMDRLRKAEYNWR